MNKFMILIFFFFILLKVPQAKIPFTTQHMLNIKLKATQLQFPAT